MATNRSLLPSVRLTTAASDNSSFYYDDYYLDVDALPCNKHAVRAFGKVFLPTVYSLLFLLGLGANLLLLVVLLGRAPRPRRPEIYLLNLAVSNLLFVATLPFWAVSAARHWVFGSFLCKAVSALYTVNFYSSILFLGCMSLDKYLELVRAWSPLGLRSRSRMLLVMVLVWAVALAASVPDVVFLQVHEYPEGVWHCDLDFSGHGPFWKLFLRLQLILLGFFLPFLVMSFFYSRILCVLGTLRHPGRDRALRIAATLVGSCFALWFPYSLTIFLHVLLDLHVFGSCAASRRLDYTMQVTESLAFCHCCFTPIFYVTSSRRFRRYLRVLLGATFKRKPAPGAPQAPPSGYPESSSGTEQEELADMDLRQRRQADGPLHRGGATALQAGESCGSVGSSFPGPA